MAIQVNARASIIFACCVLALLAFFYQGSPPSLDSVADYQPSSNEANPVQKEMDASNKFQSNKTPLQSLRIPYRTIGDLDIPADVWLPRPGSVKRDRAPVLIMIHGGAWIVGHSASMSKDQVTDSLERGWIVMSLDHRLCPGVSLLDGPMSDVREALDFVQKGGLQRAIESARALSPFTETKADKVLVDADRIIAMGASSGGHLALTLGYDVPQKPLAILDFFGVKGFDHQFWTGSIDQLKNNHSDFDEYWQPLFKQDKVIRPTLGDRRQEFISSVIPYSGLLKAVMQDSELEVVDPAMHLDSSWPPTCIVHGKDDGLLPIGISRHFKTKLDDAGIESELIEVDGEGHAFPTHIEKGSYAWNMQRKGFDFLEKILERSYDT